jgi:cytochrome c7-like protein
MKGPDAMEVDPATGGKGRPRTRLLVRTGIVLSFFAFLALAVLWTASRVAKAHGQSAASRSSQNAKDPSLSVVSPAFSPSHASVFDAVKEFFFYQSTPVQPIAFNHSLHLKHGMKCISCHVGVAQGPDAGIPSASFCMACHQVVDAKNPEIKKLAAYVAKGQNVPWQPVYWFYPTAHVQFWHAPHINAGIACQQCHGDMSQQLVAVKQMDVTMNFCLNCHKTKGVSVDCTTCHY